MRLANIAGRSTLVTSNDELVDLSRATSGRFSPRIQECYDRWEDLLQIAGDLAESKGTPMAQVASAAYGSPDPEPRQVFAMGLNYAAHAAEAGLGVPQELTVFTKFVSSLTDPYGTLALPQGTVDWEVEMVVVIGRGGHSITVEDGWEHVAGLCVGQDLSERTRQAAGPAPQYSLAKSFPGFGPIGPLLATPDEFADRDSIELNCTLNGEIVQQVNTSDMIFPVPEIIARLSEVATLLPGDVIFTGTPPGVGVGRTPQRFLLPGDELISSMERVGHMRHQMEKAVEHCTAAAVDSATATANQAPHER